MTSDAADGTIYTVSSLRDFQRFTMAHPRLLQTRDRILDAIHGAVSGSLVLVLGPTGVGKTTLRQNIEQQVLRAMKAATDSDPGQIPIVSLDVVPPLNGNFSWRDYFQRLLRAMNEPLIENKQCVGQRRSGTELQYAAEQALRYRRPVAVLIDEAQHLGKIGSGRRLLDQLDVIKSMADQTKVVHVLLGTYDLLAFRNLSGQLSRRSIDVHFARYLPEDKQDLDAFKNILATFRHKLPFETCCDFLQCWDFLYERSIGCVGVLKEWLMRASHAAVADDAKELALRHLERTALSASQCEKMLAEAREGELRLDDEPSRLRLRSLLGLRKAPVEDRAVKMQASNFSGKTTRKQFRRSPKRDRVGELQVGCGS
jgi:energy-coupling factor transporter ATP-binding protein EcfA2